MALSWLLLESGDSLLLEDGGLILTEDSTESRVGDLAITIAPVAVAAVASLTIAGTLAASIGLIGLAASSSSSVTGSLAQTLPPVTVAAGASLSIDGVVNLPLGTIHLAAMGEAGALPIAGAVAVAIEPVVVAAEGSLTPVDEGMEPVTLSEAKAHLRVFDSSEDDLIRGLIITAREWIEGYTGQLLVRGQVSQSFDRWANPLRLRAWPIAIGAQAVVSYVDPEGGDQMVASSRLSAGSRPARLSPVLGALWPAAAPVADAITVTVNAGYADRTAVPRSLRQAMLLLIGHWFANREAVNIGNITSDIPMTVEALAHPHRLPVIG
ncbi:phage conserved hypothetical protein, phiE125 gp8 family [Sphingomonas laterariae]|uniref:Phage gp6-like head-tail connector protein n=1 Tax=Edaphosphingomonas laterariae TaxID=861865 RepID=A0A239FAH0_9SPHN|nr:head-tail connector protein [Sphingomonas laterariae]SNS53293.1 phage conserved hypothetical protein, phiE125 gp8 family [Sphingomonas laterariae]